jgi:hypothetical protein
MRARWYSRVIVLYLYLPAAWTAPLPGILSTTMMANVSLITQSGIAVQTGLVQTKSTCGVLTRQTGNVLLDDSPTLPATLVRCPLIPKPSTHVDFVAGTEDSIYRQIEWAGVKRCTAGFHAAPKEVLPDKVFNVPWMKNADSPSFVGGLDPLAEDVFVRLITSCKPDRSQKLVMDFQCGFILCSIPSKVSPLKRWW